MQAWGACQGQGLNHQAQSPALHAMDVQERQLLTIDLIVRPDSFMIPVHMLDTFSIQCNLRKHRVVQNPQSLLLYP